MTEQLAEEDGTAGDDDGYQGDADQQRNAGNDHDDPKGHDRNA